MDRSFWYNLVRARVLKEHHITQYRVLWKLLEGEDTWFPNGVRYGIVSEAGREPGDIETRE